MSAMMERKGAKGPRWMGKAALMLLCSLTLVAGFAWMSSGAVFAQSYQLTWWTMDGGGGRGSAGSYALHGTVGQWDASSTQQAGNYRLTGGFWAMPQTATGEPGEPDNFIFLPKINTR